VTLYKLRRGLPELHEPTVVVALDGWVENALMELPATEVEDRYRATKDEIKRCLELGVDRMLTLLYDRKEINP